MRTPTLVTRVSVSFLFSFAAETAAHAAAGAKDKGGANLIWAIGAYAGASPFELQPAPGASNPVLIGADVGEAPIDTIAHPFLAVEGGRFHVFFTAKNGQTGQGGIALAESMDGTHWQSRGIVLREPPATLAYPCVFKSQGDYYMVPETTENVLRLYRATHFPDKWERQADLVKADKLVAPTVFSHDGHWWMFVGGANTGIVHLYHADALRGPWTEHPKSPIVKDNAHIARPAGRPFVLDGKLYRLAQDCIPTYGKQVLAFEITTLTRTDYAERPVEKPLIAATSTGWNSAAMHHVDAYQTGEHAWFAIVDARGARVPRMTH